MTTRRDFLSGSGALGAATMAARLAPLAALPWATPAAAQAADDYKALVCVFLFGGMDGNSVVIPTDTAKMNPGSTPAHRPRTAHAPKA